MRSEIQASVDVRARQRIRRRILPYLFLLYVIAYLDRVNVGYAALQMTGALHLTPNEFGFGVGIFFWGYFLLEIPGTILVEKWSARKWMARIMISWGLIAMLMGFIHTPKQFYWARLLLGAAEAGFFPGMVVYLSHWFRYEDRARIVDREPGVALRRQVGLGHPVRRARGAEVDARTIHARPRVSRRIVV